MMAYQTKMLHFVVRISNASGVVAHKYCSSDHVIVFCAIKVYGFVGNEQRLSDKDLSSSLPIYIVRSDLNSGFM